VIWSTINRPPYNGVAYDGYNRAIAAVARAHPNLHVFDWAAMARAHPQWFGPDGVHPTNTGYRARAAALARLIKSC
jgi:lysophospholipase L1-like esterase